MKILFAIPIPPPYGGIANWSMLMKKYMESDQENEIIDIIDIGPKKRGLDGRTWWDRVVGQGFRMFKLNCKLKEIIKSKKPDVLHMTTSGSLAIIRDVLMLGTAKKMGLPSVYHIRFGSIPESAKNNNLEWKLLKRAVSLSSVTIAIDEKTYKTLEGVFGNSKIVKIANPVDLSTLENIKNVQLENKIIFIGWCVKLKGIEELLLAWSKISQTHSNWYLQLVGPVKSEYKSELLGKIPMDNVIWEGEKNHYEAMNMLNKASVFILPSYTEGFPNSILEAMALSKPIIASDVGAIPEMLSDDCGIIIPSKNVDAIIKSLDMILSNAKLRSKLSNNAYNKIKNEYNIDIIYRQYMQIWKNISK